MHISEPHGGQWLMPIAFLKIGRARSGFLISWGQMANCFADQNGRGPDDNTKTQRDIGGCASAGGAG